MFPRVYLARNEENSPRLKHRDFQAAAVRPDTGQEDLAQFSGGLHSHPEIQFALH